MQGNASIPHSLKGLITSQKNFDRTFDWCLKQLNDFIFKLSISRSFFSQKAFLNEYTVILVSSPLGGCDDELVGNWIKYHGYKDDVYFL